MQNAEKKLCSGALDELEKLASLNFDWGTSWAPVHGGNTGQLGGLKPCARMDSFATDKPYHVGLAVGAFRSISKPLVEASFASSTPTVQEIVTALRAAL